MYPEFHLGSVTLHTYGLMFLAAFVAGWLLGVRRLRELGRPTRWAFHMVFWALIGGTIGARLYYAVQQHHDLTGRLLSGSGTIWYGGALGGAIAVIAWVVLRSDLRLLGAADLVAPPLALGQAIGRIGCQLSGDGDYGKHWDGTWAMAYPDGTLPTRQKVHPTPIYETLALGIGALILWNLRDRVRDGILMAIYLVYVGTERFLVEFIRRNHHVFVGLTAAQLESLAMMVAGSIWIAIAAQRGRLRTVPAPA
jgi:phosphatidylglycerol---prolipoprotein diacylglyceryl transferase